MVNSIDTNPRKGAWATYVRQLTQRRSCGFGCQERDLDENQVEVIPTINEDAFPVLKRIYNMDSGQLIKK